MDPFQEFFKAVKASMAKKIVDQVDLPSDILSPANAMSAKFYSGVPTDSLYAYLQSAEAKEDYKLCTLIRDEINRR